jgi:hypothetical protein
MSQCSPQTDLTVWPATVDTASSTLPSSSPPQTSASLPQVTFFVSVAVTPDPDNWKTLTLLRLSVSQFFEHFFSATLNRMCLSSTRMFASQYFISKMRLLLVLAAKNRQTCDASRSLSRSDSIFGAAIACVVTKIQAVKLHKSWFIGHLISFFSIPTKLFSQLFELSQRRCIRLGGCLAANVFIARLVVSSKQCFHFETQQS